MQEVAIEPHGTDVMMHLSNVQAWCVFTECMSFIRAEIDGLETDPSDDDFAKLSEFVVTHETICRADVVALSPSDQQMLAAVCASALQVLNRVGPRQLDVDLEECAKLALLDAAAKATSRTNDAASTGPDLAVKIRRFLHESNTTTRAIAATASDAVAALPRAPLAEEKGPRQQSATNNLVAPTIESALTPDLGRLVLVKTGTLKVHPRLREIFGEPRRHPTFAAVRESILLRGLQEPPIVTADRFIISGDLRVAAVIDAHGPDADVQVRVHPAFTNDDDLVNYAIAANLERKQFTPEQQAHIYRVARGRAVKNGEVAKRGRPKKGEEKKVTEDGTISPSPKTRDVAAALAGVSRDKAEALQTVFETPGVPDALKAAVNAKEIPVARAAATVRKEKKKQGGTIRNASALMPRRLDAPERDVGDAPPAVPARVALKVVDQKPPSALSVRVEAPIDMSGDVREVRFEIDGHRYRMRILEATVLIGNDDGE